MNPNLAKNSSFGIPHGTCELANLPHPLAELIQWIDDELDLERHEHPTKPRDQTLESEAYKGPLALYHLRQHKMVQLSDSLTMQ